MKIYSKFQINYTVLGDIMVKSILIFTEELKTTKNVENLEHQLVSEVENSRNKMIDLSLKKIVDLETQLKEIPLLKLRLAVLEDEKRVLELKLLNSTPQVIHRNIITNVPLTPQRKSPVQLAGLNENTLKKVKDIGIATNSIFKRDIACSTFSINQKSIGLDPIEFEIEEPVVIEEVKPILVSIATETDFIEEVKIENPKENIPLTDNSTQCDLTNSNVVKISRSVQFSPNVAIKSTQYVRNIQNKATDTTGVITSKEVSVNTDIKESKSVSVNTVPPVEKVVLDKGTDTKGFIISKDSSSNTDCLKTKSISVNTNIVSQYENSTQTETECITEEIKELEPEKTENENDIELPNDSKTPENEEKVLESSEEVKLIELKDDVQNDSGNGPSGKILQRQSTFTVQEIPALSISPMTVVSTASTTREVEEVFEEQVPTR